MTDRKSNGNRRKLLKSIAAGGGAIVAGKSLPENWAKPIVDSVVLPAHAATTEEEEPVFSYWELGAQATGVGGIEPNENGIHACIVVTGDMADVTFQGGGNNLRRTATVPLDGTRVSPTVDAAAPNCQEGGSTKEIFIVSHNPGVSITFGFRTFRGEVERGGYDVTIQAGSCGSFPTLTDTDDC